MQVLALNSSPRMEKGSTASILNPFLEGMAQAGAGVELIYVHELNIKPCLGCFSCWARTPGKCAQTDDMAALHPKLAAADVLVLATPVYVDGMTGTMKTLLDRMIPLVQPFFEIRDDHCRHPRREGTRSGQVVLVSVSGFTEMDNFDPLVAHVQAICKNMDRDFAGALLRPCAWALPAWKQRGVPVEDVYEAARDAGQQLVQDGRMADHTLATVSREVIPRKEIVEALNRYYRQALDTP